VAESKYAGCIHEMEHPPAKHDPAVKIGVPLTYSRRINPEAEFHFEVFTHTQPCALSAGRMWALKGTWDSGSKVEDTPHYHIYDEYFMFIGSNAENNLDLGGEIELWLGLGEDAEQYIITKPSTIHIPAGLVHGPTVYRRVDRPLYTIVIAPTTKFYSYHVNLLPPTFKLPPGI
jgi:hypothetical protein